MWISPLIDTYAECWMNHSYIHGDIGKRNPPRKVNFASSWQMNSVEISNMTQTCDCVWNRLLKYLPQTPRTLCGNSFPIHDWEHILNRFARRPIQYRSTLRFPHLLQLMGPVIRAYLVDSAILTCPPRAVSPPVHPTAWNRRVIKMHKRSNHTSHVLGLIIT